MRPIVMLVDSSGIGGIERHIAVLTRALIDRGHNAHILLLDRHGDNPWTRQLDDDRLPYSYLDGGVGDLVGYLASIRAALLHTHGYKAGILGRIGALAAGVPSVSTFHAGESGAFPVSLYQRLDAFSSFSARRVSVTDQISRHLPYRSTVIPNFIRISEEPVGPLGESIAFVGRLSPEKGPEVFCQAAVLSSPDMKWEVFGDGPLREALQRRYGGTVIFHGFISDTRKIWERVGLLVISSFAEGLPMAALEAMAAGVPVAATSTGALPELIENGRNGWLFNPGDSAALGRIVDDWRSDKETHAPLWRNAAWRRVRDQFGLDAGREKILAVYREAGYAH